MAIADRLFYIRSMPLVAYKFRCYPNRTQQKLLAQYFGAKRFVWNLCLNWRKEAYRKDGESVTGIDFSRELTWLKTFEPYRWLRDVPATVLVQGLRDQDVAFSKFFKEGAGYPKLKSRRQRQSIRFQLDQRRVERDYEAGKRLRLTGLGELTIRWSRVPQGTPKMVTLSRDTAGRYFVSMGIEVAGKTLPVVGRSVGVDLGVNHLAVLSDGRKIDNPRHIQQRQAALKKLQQRLSRQQKGSSRLKKTKQRIARLHARIADARQDHLHQLSTAIVRDNQVIAIEDLNVKGMGASAKGDRENPGRRVKQKAGLNRSLRDAAFGELTRQIEYKAGWYGRTVLKVDRYFPSSKTCSHCHHGLDELDLSQRAWTCPKCGIEHDRDINAAINLLDEGLKTMAPAGMKGPKLRDFGGEGACPVAVSPRSSDQPITGQEPA